MLSKIAEYTNRARVLIPGGVDRLCLHCPLTQCMGWWWCVHSLTTTRRSHWPQRMQPLQFLIACSPGSSF